jgi:hypothetical protein
LRASQRAWLAVPAMALAPQGDGDEFVHFATGISLAFALPIF